MNKYVKIPIFIISILITNLSFGQLKQSIKIPIQGKTLNFSPSTGDLLGIGELPIPNPSDYPNIDPDYLNDGSPAKDVQHIVTDDKGELLFFIKDNMIYDYRGVGGISDESYRFSKEKDYFIRNLQVVPMDGECYKYLLVWHEIGENNLTRDNGISSDIYYMYVYVNSDKTLGFDGTSDNNALYPQNIIRLTKYDYSVSASNGNEVPGGFVISKLKEDNRRFIFIHDGGTLLTYEIKNGNVNSQYVDSSFVELTAHTEDCTYWDECELLEKDNYYYYTFAYSGVHSKINLVFIKFNADGEKVFETYKNIGYIYFEKKYVYEFLKGLEFSENGDYLYFTQITKGLRYLATDFLFSETEPGNIGVVDAINEDYQYSHIELGRDKKFYLINGRTKTLTSIASTDDPNNLIITTDIGKDEGINNLILNSKYYIEHSDIDRDYKIFSNYALTKQIDGSDYTSYYDNVSRVCCVKHFDYDVEDDNKIITESGTWTPDDNPFAPGSADIYFRGNLTINPGVEINVDDLTLYFREGKGIKIRSNPFGGDGAEVTLRNSKCTAFDACEDNTQMWKGITLEGNFSKDKDKQPQLRMFRSTIEYAERGVNVKGGGILRSNYSTFKDNIYATYFSFYIYPQKSTFWENTFQTTEDLRILKNKKPKAFSRIELVNGIKFKGDTFINKDGGIEAVKGMGIDIYGGNVIVDNSCGRMGWGGKCYDPHHATFKNLSEAIKADASVGVSVKHAMFIENYRGISLGNNSTSATILNNDFNVANKEEIVVIPLPWGDITIPLPVYGLAIGASPNFIVQNNVFHSGIAGMYVRDLGNDDRDQVRRNRFYTLEKEKSNWTGIVATGTNGELENRDRDGLNIRCNKFDKNDYSIAVIDGNIARLQDGENNIGPSGNWFDHNNDAGGATDFYVENSLVDNYNYIQHANNLATPSAPELLLDRTPDTYNAAEDFYTYPEVQVSTAYGFSDNSWEKACPDRYKDDGGIDFVVGEMISIADDLQSEIEEKKDILNPKIDAGDTPLLFSKVENLSTYNYSSVSKDLQNVGPYLSDKVLINFMENTIYRPLEKTIVLLANSPLPFAAKQKIDGLNIPSYLKTYLKQFQKGEYQREKDEREISGLIEKREYLITEGLAFTISNDTVPEKLDSLVQWLESKDDLSAYYRLVPVYISQKRYDNALSTLDKIIDKASEEGGSILERAEKYTAIEKINIDIFKDIDNKNNIIGDKLSVLEDIAEGNGKEASIAKDMLFNYDKESYADYVAKYPLPNKNRSVKAMAPIAQQNFDAQEIPSISVYPNPTNGILNVSYINIKGNATINIYDLQGRIVKTFKTKQNFGFETINLSGLNKGTYLIGFEEKQTAKFILK